MRTALARVGEEEGSSQEDAGGARKQGEGKGGMGTDSIRHTKRGQEGWRQLCKVNIFAIKLLLDSVCMCITCILRTH